MNQTLANLFELMKSTPSFSCGTQSEERKICDVASQLGIVLPGDYRTFLSIYSWAKWFGRSTYGIYGHALATSARDYDTVRRTRGVWEESRPAGWKTVPLKGNVLYAPGEVIFQYSADSDRPGAVVELDFDAGARNSVVEKLY
jgi:hypothetical protein